MGGAELPLIREAFESNWIAPLGPHVDGFEREMAERSGVAHGAALSSGTAALHLALILLGVERGDDVLCSTLTFSATANAITYVGANPVFVDSNAETWNVDPQLLREELEKSARRGRLPAAAIVVDLYGQCADYAPIMAVCDEFGVPIIEDAAEALGATYRERPAGSLGKIGVFSFNGNKIITTSGGGMLVSDDLDLVERARFLATQSRDPAPHYEHSVIGYNYRMSNISAAIGRGQLRVLDDRVQARRANFEAYQTGLGDLPGLEFMPEAEFGMSNRWLTCCTIDPTKSGGVTREMIRLALEDEDVEARPVWKPMHLQPVFHDCRVIGGAVAERLFEYGLCLPSGSNLSVRDRERVISIIRDFGWARNLGVR